MRLFGSVLTALIGLYSASAFAQETSPAAPPIAPAISSAPAIQSPAQTPAAAAPQAVIQTSLGTITVALDPAHAPRSVENFMRYAREGHFDGTVIYRVVPGFVLQMGSYDASGSERPAHAPIPLESGNSLSNTRGSVAMARDSDPDTAAAEFFIDVADNTRLDAHADAPPHTKGYAVFGKVISGMDVADKIAGVALGGQGGPFPPEATPVTPVTIEKVTVNANK